MRSLAGPTRSVRWLIVGTLATTLLVPTATIAEPRSEPTAASEVVIASVDEPGTRLHLEGRVVDATSSRAVGHARISVYHADDAGEYRPLDPSDESTARLRADLVSAADGSFTIETVLPGEYPDQPPGNRHIHVHSVEADGYASRGFVILFEGNVREAVRTWATDTGFGEIIELKPFEDGLAGAIEVRLQPLAAPTPEPASVSPEAP